MIKKSLFCVLVFATILGFSKDSRAEPQLQVRAELAPSLSSGTRMGVGGDLRLGYQLSLPLLFFTPQVGVGYHRFPGEPGVPDVSVAAPYVGAQIGLGSTIRPYVDAHVGGAHRAYDSPLPLNGWSPYFDVGAGLGIRVTRHVEFGGHMNMGFATATNNVSEVSWLGVGVDMSLYF